VKGSRRRAGSLTHHRNEGKGPEGKEMAVGIEHSHQRGRGPHRNNGRSRWRYCSSGHSLGQGRAIRQRPQGRMDTSLGPSVCRSRQDYGGSKGHWAWDPRRASIIHPACPATVGDVVREQKIPSTRYTGRPGQLAQGRMARCNASSGATGTRYQEPRGRRLPAEQRGTGWQTDEASTRSVQGHEGWAAPRA